MGKTWQTKRQIMHMLSEGSMNVTEIADRLGMSQATVSQHLAELKDLGAIEEVNNEHVKKWKYYRANPNFNTESFMKGEKQMGNMGKIAIGVAVVVVIGLVALGLTYGHPAQTKGNLVLSITDPPQVPAGTSALNISYSSVQAHVVSSGAASSNALNSSATGWINATGSGTLDLMKLINVTQVIGSAEVPNGSSVNMLRFYVNSASITINGTTYNVTLPSSQVTAKVSTTAVNGSAQAIIEMSPVVIAIYGQNSTTFVMVPSVKAVVIPSQHRVRVTLGTQARLNETERVQLEHVQPQLSIASTALAVSNSTTSFSVTLHNTANVPVTINHVMLFGNMSVTVSPISPFSDHGGENAQGSANASTRENVTVHSAVRGAQQKPPLSVIGLSGTVDGSANTVMDGGENPGMMVNGTLTSNGEIVVNSGGKGISVDTNGSANSSEGITPTYSINGTSGGDHTETGMNAEDAVRFGYDNHVNIDLNGSGLPYSGAGSMLNATFNASVRARMNASFNSTLSDIVDVGVLARSMHVLNFEVSSNGTLILPQDMQMFKEGGVGYTIAPNATATFSFSGPVVLANGHLKISPISGDTYNVVVQGEEGARASTNVTAG